VLNNETVSVWNSKTNEITRLNFNAFYTSKKPDNYVITLANYGLQSNNNNLKDKLKSQIKFPNNKHFKTDNFGYNIWASSHTHDTGLHYDDEDGILSILEGEKKITLFPPSDIKYLYPFEVNYEWKNSTEEPPVNFRYNSYTHKGKAAGGGISSSQLLYETAKHDKRVLANISKLYKDNTLSLLANRNRLIWGVKKHEKLYRWELYKYNLNNSAKKKPVIFSYDIIKDEIDIGKQTHYYFNNDVTVNLPFWGHGTYTIDIDDTLFINECKLFVLDSYTSFCSNYDRYMDTLEYSDIKIKFKDVILYKYASCYELCIHNKNNTQIFVQYLGISAHDFLEFLVHNDYSENIVTFVKEKMRLNLYNINNEITIVYDKSTLEIIRTGFYGII
jgi:hypothetical protein